MRKPAPTRTALSDHLAAAAAFARLSGQVVRLRHMQTLLDAVLPAHLLPGTRIANLKRGRAVIHAASGAVAVKLRQLAPRLTENFVLQGQELTGIEVRVQARPPGGGVRPSAPAKQIGHRARLALNSLAAGLEGDSPVKQALERLLANAK